MRQIEQPTKYKIAINIELSFPAGGDKGPKRNIGITTPGINSNNSGHPLIVSPSDRIMATTKNPIHVIGNKHPVAFWKRLSILKKSVDHFCYSYGFILLHESNFSSKVKFLHLDTYKLKLFFISATGVSSAILAKSITYSNLLAGDPKVSRQGFFCSNLSYQNQFNLTKTRRVV